MAMAVPIAYAVMVFIQAHSELSPYIKRHNLWGVTRRLAFSSPPFFSPYIKRHNLWGVTLILLGFAVEWMLFVSAMVWWETGEAPRRPHGKPFRYIFCSKISLI
uniref:Uncharacterized protein n=1 Tax=Acidithiobacillus sulfuriphilus TaxID=1867749 RepID=A0A3M8R325_9PROT|nr:hypothetical protein EC580_07130 [Acidithiobacillus sulfuriphilus]